MELIRRNGVWLVLAGILGLGNPAQGAVMFGGAPPSDDVYSITFSKPNVVNPVVNFPDVPKAGETMKVSFGTRFIGQTYGEMHNSLDDTSPTPPLRLDPTGTVKTMFDMSAGGIVLGGIQGQAMFTTPLAILFSSAVNYVAFSLGHLDVNTDTRIEAFDSNGNSLGVFANLPSGFIDVTLTEASGDNVIAGISIYVPSHGMDWEGFGINNFQFGLDDDSGGGGDVPEPGTLVVWSLLAGSALACLYWKHRAK
jgi:hypothetical protein